MTCAFKSKPLAMQQSLLEHIGDFDTLNKDYLIKAYVSFDIQYPFSVYFVPNTLFVQCTC